MPSRLIVDTEMTVHLNDYIHSSKYAELVL